MPAVLMKVPEPRASKQERSEMELKAPGGLGIRRITRQKAFVWHTRNWDFILIDSDGNTDL